MLHRLSQVMRLLPSFLFDAELVVGDVDGGRLDRARSSLGGGSRRRHARIQRLEGSGRCLGRCTVADGYIPFCGAGVNFDSFQSFCAMGRFQLVVGLDFFGGGGGRSRACSGCKGLRDLVVIFAFFRDLCIVWLLQLSPYPFCTYLYQHVCTYLYQHMSLYALLI